MDMFVWFGRRVGSKEVEEVNPWRKVVLSPSTPQKTLFECLDVRFGGLRLGVGILVGEAWVPC